MLTLSYIKNTICAAVIACSSLYGFAQDTIMYHGGYYDGFARGLFSSFSPQQLNQQYAYAGGSGDGYSIVNINTFSPQMPNHFAAYTADTNTRSDGYAALEDHNYDREFLAQYTAYTSSAENDGYAGQLILNAPLPIELILFTGEAVGNTSLLKWTVADEKNIIRYELERSKDGKQYTGICTQAVNAPVDTRTERQHIDPYPFNGKNFYRLKIFSQDEKYQYSNTLLLVFNRGSESLVVYPNPARVSFSVSTNQKINSIVLLNMAGQEVKWYPASPDNNYSLQGVLQGMYIMNIDLDDEKISVKIVVQ